MNESMEKAMEMVLKIRAKFAEVGSPIWNLQCTERSTCGVFHQKSRSPQVLVVILITVGPKVRERSTSGANMFDSMCT